MRLKVRSTNSQVASQAGDLVRHFPRLPGRQKGDERAWPELRESAMCRSERPYSCAPHENADFGEKFIDTAESQA